MNEREQPADGFERAPKNSEIDATPIESFSEPISTPELATAYSRRSRRAGGPPHEGADAQTLTNGAPDARRSEFRLRDFRPEGSGPAVPTFGAHPTPTHPEPTRDIPEWTPLAVEDDGHLAYQTQAVPMVGRAQTPPRAVVDSVPAELAGSPRPMTRRELRELESRQGIRPSAEDSPVVAAAPAPAAPPAPTAAPRRAAAPATAPRPATPEEPVELILPPTVQLAPAVAIPAPTPFIRPAAAAEPVLPPVDSPEPVIFTAASGAASSNRPPAPAPVNRGIDSAPTIFTVPDSHWSTQTHIDAPIHPGDSFFRTAGSSAGALTTAALVIPSIPQADITMPFSRTGEILITGSIALPMSLGSTGANSARYDHSDIDALFAQEDHDYASTDAAPVRAIRAVSTHTSTHGVISARKPASNRLPMMMAVTAGVLAVGVAALFAAGMFFGYF